MVYYNITQSIKARLLVRAFSISEGWKNVTLPGTLWKKPDGEEDSTASRKAGKALKINV